MAVRTTRVDTDTALQGTPNVRTTRVDADVALQGTPAVRVTRVDTDVAVAVIQGQVDAGAAIGAGDALNAARNVGRNAGHAAGTGTAAGTTTSIAPAIGSVAGTGAAYDATVSIILAGEANAQVAAGLGSASDAMADVAPVVALASGTGAASGAVASASQAAPASLASATGAAHDTRIMFPVAVVFDLGGTWASQAVGFDLGETGTVARQPVVFDILDESDAQPITPGVYVDGTDPSTPGAFLPGIQVYSKAGLHLGAMTYTSYGPRPKSISTWQGVHASAMTVTVPRKVASTNGNFIANPDLTLIAEDRLLVIGSSFGLEPWAGSIDTVEWTDGAAILSVQDLYGQLATALIRDTAAVKTRTGEVQWEFDGTG